MSLDAKDEFLISLSKSTTFSYDDLNAAYFGLVDHSRKEELFLVVIGLAQSLSKSITDVVGVVNFLIRTDEKIYASEISTIDGRKGEDEVKP